MPKTDAAARVGRAQEFWTKHLRECRGLDDPKSHAELMAAFAESETDALRADRDEGMRLLRELCNAVGNHSIADLQTDDVLNALDAAIKFLGDVGEG